MSSSPKKRLTLGGQMIMVGLSPVRVGHPVNPKHEQKGKKPKKTLKQNKKRTWCSSREEPLSARIGLALA